MTKKILWVATLVAAVAIVIITLLLVKQAPTSVDEKRLFLDAYTAIGIGFLVALLGTIIPNLVREGQYEFERAKRSRVAYSQAKTSVIYLPGTLAALQYGDAIAALEKAHRNLHVAETYGKELDEYLGWYGDKKTWSAQIYWQLTAARMLLQCHADQWKDLSFGDRTMRVDRALEAIQDMFGRKGEKWKTLSDKEKDSRPYEVARELADPASHTQARGHPA